MTLPALLAACLCACLPTQAQLYIDVYPSQDNPNQTLWIFSPQGYLEEGGHSRIRPYYGSAIRNINATNYHARDSWKASLSSYPDATIYYDNKPTNRVFNLTHLFSSTNNPIDIVSIEIRLKGSSRAPSPFYSGLAFSTNATKTPTMTFGNATKTIGGIFMNDAGTQDEMGIRGTPGGGNLVYTNMQRIYFSGSGVLNKPISDFDFVGNSGGRHDDLSFSSLRDNAPYFARRGSGGVVLRFYSRAIPEPAEYALVFGLFALAFVIVRRLFWSSIGK